MSGDNFDLDLDHRPKPSPAVFDATAFPWTVRSEGVFSKSPADPGNWTGGRRNKGVLKGTKYGISAAAYPTLDIAGLDIHAAKAIYWRDYWMPCRCQDLPGWMAVAVFDCAVRMGPARARRWMQAALSVPRDGKLGPVTLAAASVAGTVHFLPEFISWQVAHYAGLDNENEAEHIRGWARRLTALSIFCDQLSRG